MSRSEILPPGVDDALPLLASSMAGRPDLGSGRLQPKTAAMIFVALESLVRHVAALRDRLDGLDGVEAPEPDPLAWSVAYFAGAKASNPDGSLPLGLYHPWRIMESLAPAVLSIEARTRFLEGLPPIGPPAESPAADPLRRIVDQVELDGAMHGVEAAYWQALESLIARVPDVEARLVSLESQPRKAVTP